LNLDFFSGNESGKVYNSITQTSSILTDTINRKNESHRSTHNEALSLQSMKYCSRFDSCSAPKCPLDPLIDSRSENDWDPVCGMAKATRHKYWESMPEDLRKVLPFQGYFRAEYNRMEAARKRWESLSDDEKSRIREIGKARLMESRRKKS
jgi:hypothetical protein